MQLIFIMLVLQLELEFETCSVVNNYSRSVHRFEDVLFKDPTPDKRIPKLDELVTSIGGMQRKAGSTHFSKLIRGQGALYF